MVRVRSSNLRGITMLLIVCCLGVGVQGKYGGGTGEPNDPYQIWDANDMQAIGADANDWNKHFILMADIDLSQFDGKDGREKFNIIGKWVGKEFTGVFDGNGFEIWNFTYSSANYSDEHVGIFGYVDGSEALIKNVGLRDSHINVQGIYSAGSLVGEIEDGNIVGCHTMGGSITGEEATFDLGGLVGRIRKAAISNCYTDIAVSAPRYRPVGGLLGTIHGGMVTQCHAVGDVVGDSSLVGGLIGNVVTGHVSDCYSTGDVYGGGGGLIGSIVQPADILNSYSSGDVYGDGAGGLICSIAPDARVINCYSTGAVSGPGNTGGLAASNVGLIMNCYSTGTVTGSGDTGGLVARNIGLIMNCYSIGSVSGIDNVGGLVGHNHEDGTYSGVILNSYWDVQTSGDPNMCGYQDPNASGCDHNCGKTTAEMQQQATFADWEFINVWDIGENQTYPYLRTVLASDINKDRITNFLDLCIVAEQWGQEP